MFDLTSKKSFEAVHKYVADLKEDRYCQILVVGNKVDLCTSDFINIP